MEEQKYRSTPFSSSALYKGEGLASGYDGFNQEGRDPATMVSPIVKYLYNQSLGRSSNVLAPQKVKSHCTKCHRHRMDHQWTKKNILRCVLTSAFT
jgi:hypothetical protein